MLTEIEQETIAIGASVASGCQPCTAYHVKAARAAGACDSRLTLAVETALAVRDSATRTMDEWANQCQGARPALDPAFRADNLLVAELTAVAAAFAVNSVPDLRARLQAARELGATPEQLRSTITLAAMIKRAAEAKLADLVGEQPCSPSAQPSCCG